MKGSCDRVRASADTKPGQHRHTATPPHHRHKACCEGNESVHTGACGTSMCQHSGVTYHPTTPQRSIPPTPHRGVPSPAVGWTRLAAGCARPRQARASFPLRCAWRGGVASPASSYEEHGQPVSTCGASQPQQVQCTKTARMAQRAYMDPRQDLPLLQRQRFVAFLVQSGPRLAEWQDNVRQCGCRVDPITGVARSHGSLRQTTNSRWCAATGGSFTTVSKATTALRGRHRYSVVGIGGLDNCHRAAHHALDVRVHGTQPQCRSFSRSAAQRQQ